MEQIKEELDNILKEFLSGDKETLKTVAHEINVIVEAHEAGEIGEDDKEELLLDVAELSRVETTAEVLETKIKVEKALQLLSKLVKMV